MNEWISIEDRLPLETGNVICGNCENKSIAIGLYIKYSDDGGRWSDKVLYLTHWMPLPEPPLCTK